MMGIGGFRRWMGLDWVWLGWDFWRAEPVWDDFGRAWLEARAWNSGWTIMHVDGIQGISATVIGKAFVVSNILGAGFLEKIYENALAHELRETGLEVRQQHEIAVHYNGVIVGAYTADLLVEGVVLVELKAVRMLDAMHQAECVNYLKATRLSLCLLLNFGRPRVEIRRLANGILV